MKGKEQMDDADWLRKKLLAVSTELEKVEEAYEGLVDKLATANREVERLTPYYRAIDDLAVTTWTFDKSLTAGEQLAKIIQWEIQVATDPLVNGGKVLVDKTEIERLRDEIETYQQREDEIIVALGSQGITPAGIVPTIERLREQRDRWIETCKSEHELAERLRAALDRNVQERHRYKHIDAGHHCGWRVIAEAMIERSKEALREADND